MTTTAVVAAPDYPAIKTKQNAAWASGDYSRIGVTDRTQAFTDTVWALINTREFILNH